MLHNECIINESYEIQKAKSMIFADKMPVFGYHQNGKK
jgi:hypothetical protein